MINFRALATDVAAAHPRLATDIAARATRTPALADLPSAVVESFLRDGTARAALSAQDLEAWRPAKR